jgi:hypothetical protein
LTTRPHAYIAHPLNAPTLEEIEQNLRNAARWVAWAARHGVAPMAMWIVLASEWAETPENRELGLQIDEAQVELCSEIWVCGGRITSGMQREIDKARASGVKVVDLTCLGELPPEEDVSEWLEAWRAAA